jgi:S-adenosylmethionine hydrolase
VIKTSGIVTLLTDFGTRDPYVGVMKGVILGINPSLRIVDVTHEVPPQAVRAAAYLLASSFPFFPPGSVHVAVVDPGVGSDRKAVVLHAADHVFIAPDNGLLSEVIHAAASSKAWEISNPALCLPVLSSTFHGRDIFAPAAAHISGGFPLEQTGASLQKPRIFPRLAPEKIRDGLRGEVLWIDRFGNLVTSIRERDLEDLAQGPNWRAATVTIGTARIRGISTTYRDTTGLITLIGSTGRLEVSVSGGNAEHELRVGLGDSVIVRL